MPHDVAIVEPVADEDLDQAIRRAWAANIADQMDLLGYNDVTVVIELRKRGVSVTAAAVGQWRSGKVSPKPSMQVALAAVLRAAPRMMFSLDIAKVAA